MFTSAYFSFICAETIHWSGIISLIGCGIAQKRYAFKNISEKSLTTVKYGVKTMSALADVIIFLFLGIVVISKEFGHFPKKINFIIRKRIIFIQKQNFFILLPMYVWFSKNVQILNQSHWYHYEFSFWTVFLCLTVRFVGIYVLAAILNRRRIKTINKVCTYSTYLVP